LARPLFPGVLKSCMRPSATAALERVEQRQRAMLANQLRGWVDLHHRQPPPGCRDRVSLVRVRLFSNPYSVQLGLECRSIDYLGSSKFISLQICHRFLCWGALCASGRAGCRRRMSRSGRENSGAEGWHSALSISKAGAGDDRTCVSQVLGILLSAWDIRCLQNSKSERDWLPT
jgi:hypothetical protein